MRSTQILSSEVSLQTIYLELQTTVIHKCQWCASLSYLTFFILLVFSSTALRPILCSSCGDISESPLYFMLASYRPAGPGMLLSLGLARNTGT